jgi:hypothetical protein
MPIVPRRIDSGYAVAELAAAEVFHSIREACKAQGIAASVDRTPPYSSEIKVTFECWRPMSESRTLTERSHMIVTFRPREFHLFPVEMDIEILDASRRVIPRKMLKVVSLPDAAIQQIVRSLATGSGTIPILSRARSFSWQILLPVNRVSRLRRDWVALGLALLAYTALVIFTFPLSILWVVFARSIVTGFTNAIGKRRARFSLSGGRPPRDPRILVRLDEWQTVLQRLAPQSPRVWDRVMDTLTRGKAAGVVVESETISYWTPDGPEERRQIVVYFRRAIAFIQIYPYGDDLYVGWDAHLNRGRWAETVTQTGVDTETGQPCRAMSTVSSTTNIHEYDISDLNMLIEWVHSAIVGVSKRLIEEFHIDQETDFTIIRGDRSRLYGQGQDSIKEVKKAARRLFRLS